MLVAAVPVAAVAVLAAIQSYSHIEGLALAEHQSLADARMLPFSVDFLIVAGSVILAAGSRLGWLCVVPGIVATLLANIVTGLPFGPVAAVVAGWPALAFTVASFALERWLKSQVGQSVASTKSADTSVSAGQAARASIPDAVSDPSLPAVLNGHGTGTTWTTAPRGWS